MSISAAMMAPGVRLPAFYDSRARETFDKELTKGRQYREHLKRNNPEQYILLKQRQREATRRYRERRREVLARLRGYSPRTRQPNDENREDYSPEELPFFAGARVAGLHQGARKSSDLDMFHVDSERASGVLCKVVSDTPDCEKSGWVGLLFQRTVKTVVCCHRPLAFRTHLYLTTFSPAPNRK